MDSLSPGDLVEVQLKDGGPWRMGTVTKAVRLTPDALDVKHVTVQLTRTEIVEVDWLQPWPKVRAL